MPSFRRPQETTYLLIEKDKLLHGGPPRGQWIDLNANSITLTEVPRNGSLTQPDGRYRYERCLRMPNLSPPQRANINFPRFRQGFG